MKNFHANINYLIKLQAIIFMELVDSNLTTMQQLQKESTLSLSSYFKERNIMSLPILYQIYSKLRRVRKKSISGNQIFLYNKQFVLKRDCKKLLNTIIWKYQWELRICSFCQPTEWDSTACNVSKIAAS